MSYTTIAAVIRCSKTGMSDPRYRVFVDNILVAERRFWPETPANDITEVMSFQDDDTLHHFRIENVDSRHGEISVVRITVLDGDTKKRITELDPDLTFEFFLAKR